MRYPLLPSADRILLGEGRIRLKKGRSPCDENCAEVGKSLTLEAVLPRSLGASSVLLLLTQDKTGEETRHPLSFRALEGAFDVYTFTLKPCESGLFFYRLLIETGAGSIYGNRIGYHRALGFSRECGEPFQLTVSRFRHPAPRFLEGGILYHVFVDRFAKGGDYPLKEGAVLNPDWENGMPEYPEKPGDFLRNNEFFGGTLEGVRKKLGYLSSLGVTCLYLSPIFEAYSNHKYDTADYLTVDAMFGGEKALRRLIGDAEKMGIRVILDGVFNHTGADSLYFNKFGRYPSLGAYQSKESPYYDWYRFDEFPDRYTAWWGIEILPRIHPEAPACRDFFIGEGGVVEHYAKMGIGGMRLDVVDELDDAFVAGIKEKLVTGHPDAVLYGEVWEDASNKIAYDKRKAYYQGEELDGVMNYPLRRGLIEYFREGRCEGLAYALLEVLPNMPKRVADVTMNLLGTHDTVRILTALSGRPSEGMSNREKAKERLSPAAFKSGIRRLMMAYLALATLPGIPAIFYGDEAGMEGYDDPFNRRPYPWHKQNRSLLNHYKQVGSLRRENAVYRDGAFHLVALDREKFVFSRSKGRVLCLTVINPTEKPMKLRFASPARDLLHGERRATEFLLPPESGTVLRTAFGNTCDITF